MTKQALADLKDAKKRKKDWLEIVDILEGVRTAEAWQEIYENHSAWLTAAAESSGYSESILRRMLAASRFLEELKSEISDFERVVASGNGLPFSTIEILKRIHHVAPKKAVELFPLIARGEVSHRQVLQEQSSLTEIQRFVRPSGSKTVRRDQFPQRVGPRRPDLTFEQEAAELAEENLVDLVGTDRAKFHLKRYQFDYAVTDAVAIMLDGINVTWLDGFEFRYLPPYKLKHRSKVQLISEISMAASFFRNYWVFFPKMGELVEYLAQDFDRLGISNVGLAEIGDVGSSRLKVVRRPIFNEGGNRQTPAAATVISQGIPDIVTYV